MMRLKLLFFLTLLLCSCISQQPEKHVDKITVVVSIPPLAEFTKAIGKEKVKVEVLLPPGASPHTYEPTPKQIVELSKAKLLIINDVGLEYWIENIMKINKNLTIVDTSKGIKLIYEGEKPNPHIWLSPKNAKIQVNNICNALIEIDPANKEYYIKNKEEYLRKLDELDKYAEKKLSNVKRREFITFHPAWAYFARDYNLSQIVIEEKGKEPTPKHLTEIIKKAKKLNITIIFAEPEFNPKSVEVLAKEINAKTEFLEPLSENYITEMYKNIDKIHGALI